MASPITRLPGWWTTKTETDAGPGAGGGQKEKRNAMVLPGGSHADGREEAPGAEAEGEPRDVDGGAEHHSTALSPRLAGGRGRAAKPDGLRHPAGAGAERHGGEGPEWLTRSADDLLPDPAGSGR